MADDTKKPKQNPERRNPPEKPAKVAADEDEEMLLAGGIAVLRAIFRPRPARRRG